MSKQVTGIRVYFAGDVGTHQTADFINADSFKVDERTMCLYVLDGGEPLGVFARSEWKHAEALRTCDGCGK